MPNVKVFGFRFRDAEQFDGIGFQIRGDTFWIRVDTYNNQFRNCLRVKEQPLFDPQDAVYPRKHQLRLYQQELIDLIDPDHDVEELIVDCTNGSQWMHPVLFWGHIRLTNALFFPDNNVWVENIRWGVWHALRYIPQARHCDFPFDKLVPGLRLWQFERVMSCDEPVMQMLQPKYHMDATDADGDDPAAVRPVSEVPEADKENLDPDATHFVRLASGERICPFCCDGQRFRDRSSFRRHVLTRRTPRLSQHPDLPKGARLTLLS